METSVNVNKPCSGYKHSDYNTRRMANAVVFIFLLDHLPGNIPFQPLDTSSVLSEHSMSKIKHCDHIMSSEPVLEMISKVLKVEVVPKWRNHDKFTHAKKDIDKESAENMKTVSDTSAVDYYNAGNEDTQRLIDDDELETEIIDNRSECDTRNSDANKIEEINNFTKAAFPKNAPFMVSIFESLSNVTAQTCGGTLLSPHWILTVASCVNVLEKLFPNINETSSYTVIANASNPFLDGSVYNVTEIHLHPQSTPPIAGMRHLHRTPMIKDLAKSTDAKTPVLALMRVEPAIEHDSIGIIGDTFEGNVGVMVYGWQLVKNDTGHDSMHVTSFPATTLTSSKCRHDVTDDTICLTNITANNTQISLGGIVVAQQNGKPAMLGMAQADDHATFTVLPLSSHAVWINKMLERK